MLEGGEMHAGKTRLPRVLPAVFLGAGLALVSSAQQPISQQDAVTAGQLAGFRAVLAARVSPPLKDRFNE